MVEDFGEIAVVVAAAAAAAAVAVAVAVAECMFRPFFVVITAVKEDIVLAGVAV